MDQDVTDLQAAFASLSTDFTTFAADVSKLLGTIVPPDPAQKRVIEDVIAGVRDMDTRIKDLDTKVNPPVVTPPAPTPTPTPKP